MQAPLFKDSGEIIFLEVFFYTFMKFLFYQ
jgi:hypothetical protein